MKVKRHKILLLVLVGSLFLGSVALAAPAATTLERYVIGGGGGRTTTGIYSLEGTIGQPIVSADRGGVFRLCVGFWCNSGAFSIFNGAVYLPLVSDP